MTCEPQLTGRIAIHAPHESLAAPKDLLARYGGEEFACCPMRDPGQAVEIIERLRATTP